MKARDLVYIGLGSLLIARDRIEKELEHLAEKGKEGRGEIEKFLDAAKDRAKKEFEGREEAFRAKFKEEVHRLGLVTQEDIEELKETLKAPAKTA